MARTSGELGVVPRHVGDAMKRQPARALGVCLPRTHELERPAAFARSARLLQSLPSPPRARRPRAAAARHYAIINLSSSRNHPLGDAVETFIRRPDADRFIEAVRGDDPELATSLRLEERELEA